jgi:hypothetical protein
MLRTARHHGRTIPALGAGLVAGAVLAGCAANQPQTAPAAATGPAESSATPGSSSDLAAGLLPADAFGAGADVEVFPFDGAPYLDDWDHWGPGHWGHDDESGTPTACETAMDQAADRFGDVEDAAGQVARADGVRTFEVLAVPAVPAEPGAVVKEFQAVIGACDAASFSEEHGDDDHGDVQVSIDELSGLPDGMAGVSLTFSGTYDDGSWSATSLFGVAQDGDRVLALAQMSWDDDDTTLDPAAFTALLQQAYDVQAKALD